MSNLTHLKLWVAVAQNSIHLVMNCYYVAGLYAQISILMRSQQSNDRRVLNSFIFNLVLNFISIDRHFKTLRKCS